MKEFSNWKWLKKKDNDGYDKQNDKVHENKRDEIKKLLIIAMVSSAEIVDIHYFLHFYVYL